MNYLDKKKGDDFLESLDNQLPPDPTHYTSVAKFFNALITQKIPILPLVNIKRDVSVDAIHDKFIRVKREIVDVLLNYTLSPARHEMTDCGFNCKAEASPLFTSKTNLPNCFEINPRITGHVKNSYTDVELLANVPIYFFIKMGGADLLGHSTLLIYFQSKLYSLGFAARVNTKTKAKNATIMFGDYLIINHKFRPKILKDSLYLVDVGLLTTFHLRNINSIIRQIDTVDLNVCFKTCKRDRVTISNIRLDIGLRSNYCQFAPNPTARFNSSFIPQMMSRHSVPKIYTNRQIPSVMNCTSSLQWIFSQSVLCVGSSAKSKMYNTISKSLVIPGLCKRIKFIETKGYPVYDPITPTHVANVFKLMFLSTTTIAQFNQALKTTPSDIPVTEVAVDEILVSVSPEKSALRLTPPQLSPQVSPHLQPRLQPHLSPIVREGRRTWIPGIVEEENKTEKTSNHPNGGTYRRKRTTLYTRKRASATKKQKKRKTIHQKKRKRISSKTARKQS